MTDEDLKALYKHYESVRDPRARADCPSPEMLAIVAEGGGSGSERETVRGHVTKCPQCRREFERLRSLHLAHAPAGALPRWVVLATSAILVFIGGLLVGRLLWPPGSLAATQESAFAPITPSGAVGPAERAFLWRADSGARLYRVTVLDSAAAVIWETSVPDTTVMLPDPIQLSPGASYEWRVTALGRDGTEHRSPVTRFSISR
ncbi:MAG: hypothetical protein ABI647_00425 [Gemmatimonadota bacterium]